jgi:hypothetical protein
MRGVLVLINPFDPVAGSRIDIRVGQSKNSRTLSADGVLWHSALSRAPKISMEFVDDDIRGGLQAGKGGLAINTRRIRGLTTKYLDSLIWSGAPITIWSGDAGATADMTLEFIGTITDGTSIDRHTGQLVPQFEVDKKLVDVPMLNLEYGGGGGADGDVEVRGQLKPAAFGNPVNVPVFFFDQVNNVGQIDAYGNCTAINVLYEDAASFGTKIGDYASYAALVAATIPEGEWGTCVAQGMIRLGAPPKGVITTDPVCGAAKPGLMMLRWLQTHAGVSSGRINSTSFNTLDTDLTTLLGHAPAVSFFTQGQVNVLERMQAMCASCNAVPLLCPDGSIAVAKAITSDGAALTLQRHGGSPAVLAWSSPDAPVPWWRLKMSAEITYRVHDDTEIDYEDDLVDLGDYLAGDTYRIGNIVRLPSDGNRYLYINDVPSTFGPPNATYWQLYEEAPDATVVKYADGVPVETLRPAEPGANLSGGGLNELADTTFLNWSLSGGVTRVAKAASNGFAIGNQPWAIELAPGTSTRTAVGPLVSVVGGQPYYFSLAAQRNSGVNAAAQLKGGGDWLDSAGATISAANPEMVPQTTTTLTAGAIPLENRWNQVAPATARFFRPKISVPAVTSGQATGAFRAEYPRVSAVEFAADVTTSVNGPSTITINYDYTGTVLAGQLPKNQDFTLVRSGATVTSGITWQYKVKTGGVNSLTSASGMQSMSGSSAGTLTVTTLDTSNAEVEIFATLGGITYPQKVVQLVKSIAAAPSGGGGGGGSSDAMFSFSGPFINQPLTTTTYTDATGSIFSVALPTGRTGIRINFLLELDSDQPTSGFGSTTSTHVKIQRKISGTFTDKGVVQDATVTWTKDAETLEWTNDVGYYNYTFDDTGLTPGVSYEYRLVDAKVSGVKGTYLSGVVTGTAIA